MNKVMSSRSSLPEARRSTTTSSLTELLSRGRDREDGFEPSSDDKFQLRSDLPQNSKGYTSFRSGPVPHSQARSVRNKGPYRSLAICSDLLLGLTPVFFVFLAIAGMLLDQTRTADSGDSFGDHVEEATKVAPTLFPIVFAAVAARSLRIYGRFKAERGASLGLLETLLGSRSVFATIETQYLIRRPTITGILILLLWTLSPLGGQASLRLLTRGHTELSSPASFKYFDTGPAAGIWPTSGFGPSGSAYEAIESALLSAAIMSTDETKLSSHDPWMNVKIPRVDTLPLHSDAWTDWSVVPDITSAQDYTSLIGIPIVGLQNGTTSALSIETSYVDFNCTSPVESIADDAFWRRTWGTLWGPSQTNPLNYTIHTQDPTNADEYPTMFMETYLTLDDDSRQMAYFGLDLTGNNASDPLLIASRHITFGSVSESLVSSIGVVTTNCSISTVHVESSVVCDSMDCRVDQMRRSTTDKRPSSVSFLDVVPMGQIFMQLLPTTGGSQGQVLSSFAEIFLNNTSLAPFNTAISQNFVNLTTVSADDLSKRLTAVANTYFLLMTAPGAILGDREPNLAVYGPDSTPMTMIDTWFGQNATLEGVTSSIAQSRSADGMPLLRGRIDQLKAAPFVAASAQGFAITLHEVFVCNFVWAAMLLVSSLVLLALGTSAVVINALLVAPDVLGYVSSMTYDNPHLQIDAADLPLDAMERARRLRDLKVRLGDVRGDRSVGRVAFTAVQSSTPLRRQRTYSSGL